MGKFNSCINRVNVQLKSFPGYKAVQLDHHTIPILQEQLWCSWKACRNKQSAKQFIYKKY